MVREAYCTCLDFYLNISLQYQFDTYQNASDSSSDFNAEEFFQQLGAPIGAQETHDPYSDLSSVTTSAALVLSYPLTVTKAVKVSVLWFCVILGIPFNLLILYVSLSNVSRSPASKWLVINLTITDLLILVHAILVILSETKFTFKFPNNFSCQYYEGSNQFFITASLLAICVIAFDRYYVISGKAQSGVFRESGNFFYSHRFPCLSIFVWLLAFLLTYPVFYVAKLTNIANYSGEDQCLLHWTTLTEDDCHSKFNNPNLDMQCIDHLSMCTMPQYLGEKIYWSIFWLFGFLIPIVITIFCYIRIISEVRMAKERIHQLGRSNVHLHSASKNSNLVATIASSFLSTIICWVPFMSWKIIRIFEIYLPHKACYDYKGISDTFVWFSPVLNPILYSLIGKNFRRKLKITIHRLCGIKERRDVGRLDSVTQCSTYSTGRNSCRLNNYRASRDIDRSTSPGRQNSNANITRLNSTQSTERRCTKSNTDLEVQNRN